MVKIVKNLWAVGALTLSKYPTHSRSSGLIRQPAQQSSSPMLKGLDKTLDVTLMSECCC